MIQFFSLCVVLLVTLVMSLAHGEVTQCSPSHTQPKLRFVAQLSVNGCPIFVSDTGANDGPHLAVEPLMCVTQSLHKVFPRYDPITQQTYVSVPVMLRDDAMLTEVEHQLRHLSPKSVKFSIVSDINVSINTSSEIQILDFISTPEESVGFLKLGYSMSSVTCPAWKMFNIMFRAFQTEIVNRIMATANVEVNGTQAKFKYHLMLQNSGYFDPDIYRSNFDCLTECKNARLIRSVFINNCTARVHQRLDMKGHFLIEPLLCHNITSITNESIMYDYSRDMYYLKLDVVLQDDITLDVVRSQLADLSPLNVTFMRLWRAENVVAAALSRRFEIGELMVSGDWRSGQMRVYCRTSDDCKDLRLELLVEPVNFWRHIKTYLTSLVANTCIVLSKNAAYYMRLRHISDKKPLDGYNNYYISKTGIGFKLVQGTTFISIQQRLTGSVSFQRSWNEYETGFGDKTDFWIGLSTIHSLSINGVTLRVEMKLWNGTELHAEYAGFKVGDASTNYTMTYRDMIRDRSSFSRDGLGHNKGMQFSTMDIDNDGYSRSCSNSFGKGGWWFNSCHNINYNGIYGGGSSPSDMVWDTGSARLPLREVRLMLQF